MTRELTEPQDATRVEACALIELPSFKDERGTLAFMEGNKHIPFPIARVFYLYGVPAGSMRAGHALKSCSQVIIALGGSFTVVLTDGESRREVKLSDPSMGLCIPPKVWREITDFTAGATCLVLASEPYDPDGYYEKFEDYVREVRSAD
jgi:dTDP-4-dehydrorhamnose 3,5-epimerase-like enzyme